MKVLFVNGARVKELLPMDSCVGLMRDALTTFARGARHSSSRPGKRRGYLARLGRPGLVTDTGEGGRRVEIKLLVATHRAPGYDSPLAYRQRTR